MISRWKWRRIAHLNLITGVKVCVPVCFGVRVGRFCAKIFDVLFPSEPQLGRHICRLLTLHEQNCFEETKLMSIYIIISENLYGIGTELTHHRRRWPMYPTKTIP